MQICAAWSGASYTFEIRILIITVEPLLKDTQNKLRTQ